MSYYSRNHTDTDTSLATIVFCIILVFLIICCTNSCHADIWNNGVCPKCEIKYELRGVSNGLKYYICPNCKQEVERY